MPTYEQNKKHFAKWKAKNADQYKKKNLEGRMKRYWLEKELKVFLKILL